MNHASYHDERIANMTFASVYPHYVAKVEKKGRTNRVAIRAIHESAPTWLPSLDRQQG